MAEIRRVLLVQPMAGARWKSITAYAGSLAGMLSTAGIEADMAFAPWFNPPSLVAGRRARWTGQDELRKAAEGAYDLIHLTDHALGHHVDRFRKLAPTVVTCHDLMPLTLAGYYAGRAEGITKRAFLRRPYRALKRADLVIAVSAFTKGELQQHGYAPPRVEVVPNVVRPVFQPVAKGAALATLREAGVEWPGVPVVLSVGNDRAYKNLPALIEAMGRPALTHASLVRVGPDLPADLRKLADGLGVARRFHTVSAPSDELLRCVYAAADVLAQPSLGEGFGIPVIEAMAVGLPVVVSDGGALPEVVGTAAEVVPLGGEDFAGRLAAGLARALEPGRSSELRLAGLSRAAAFDAAAVTGLLLSAYGSAGATRLRS